MDFQDKINQLPQSVKDFFFSNDLRIEMEKTCFLYGIEDEDTMSYISDLIASIFIEETSLVNLPDLVLKRKNLEKNVAYGLSYELNKKIFTLFPSVFRDSEDLLSQWEKLKTAPLISEQEAMSKVVEIEPWISEEEKEEIRYQRKIREEKEIQKQIVEKMTIAEALRKYPEIGEQLLTLQHIRLKIFPEPVRPSIKNWLSDYTFDLGYESHDSMIRGDYLFKSENGKNLPQEEREKLSLILKSYDDNIPLSVDTVVKQIIFPARQKTEIMRQENTYQEPVSSQKSEEAEESNIKPALKFSSPQVFANENNPVKTSLSRPIRITPVSRENFNEYQQKGENLARNVINLKE